MNRLFFATLLFLISYYVITLNLSTGIGLILFALSIVCMAACAFQELSKGKKRIRHLRLVK